MTVKLPFLEQLFKVVALQFLYNIARCENGYNSLDEISLKNVYFSYILLESPVLSM